MLWSVVSDPDLVRLFIEPLEGIDLPYFITGGVAAVVYGDPRFTRDIDIVMVLRREDAPRLERAFSGGDFYVPPMDVLLEEAGRPRGGHFNLIHRDTALRADVYLSGDDPLHAWAFERRRRVTVEGFDIWLAPLEYVIVRKLDYYQRSLSDRHLRDVRMMLRISGDTVDRGELDRWITALDLRAEMDRAEADGSIDG